MTVEQKAEAMERIASQSQEVEWLGSGYGGGAVVEGSRVVDGGSIPLI